MPDSDMQLGHHYLSLDTADEGGADSSGKSARKSVDKGVASVNKKSAAASAVSSVSKVTKVSVSKVDPRVITTTEACKAKTLSQTLLTQPHNSHSSATAKTAGDKASAHRARKAPVKATGKSKRPALSPVEECSGASEDTLPVPLAREGIVANDSKNATAATKSTATTKAVTKTVAATLTTTTATTATATAATKNSTQPVKRKSLDKESVIHESPVGEVTGAISAVRGRARDGSTTVTVSSTGKQIQSKRISFSPDVKYQSARDTGEGAQEDEEQEEQFESVEIRELSTRRPLAERRDSGNVVVSPSATSRGSSALKTDSSAKAYFERTSSNEKRQRVRNNTGNNGEDDVYSIYADENYPPSTQKEVTGESVKAVKKTLNFASATTSTTTARLQKHKRTVLIDDDDDDDDDDMYMYKHSNNRNSSSLSHKHMRSLDDSDIFDEPDQEDHMTHGAGSHSPSY